MPKPSRERKKKREIQENQSNFSFYSIESIIILTLNASKLILSDGCTLAVTRSAFVKPLNIPWQRYRQRQRKLTRIILLLLDEVRKIELLCHLIKLRDGKRERRCCLQRCNQSSGLCNTSSLVWLIGYTTNIPALMNPFAMAWAIFPPPMNPILCILKFTNSRHLRNNKPNGNIKKKRNNNNNNANSLYT